MRTDKIKSSKFYDAIMETKDAQLARVVIATRLQPTNHGEFFRDLVGKVALEMVGKLSDVRPSDLPSAAHHMVRYCHEVTKAAVETMQADAMLAVNLPSYEQLQDKLRADIGTRE